VAVVVVDLVVPVFMQVLQAGPGVVVRDEETQLAVLAPAVHLCKVSMAAGQELVLLQEQVLAAVVVAHQKQESTPAQLLPAQAATELNLL
jgi:hypothetical protein